MRSDSGCGSDEEDGGEGRGRQGDGGMVDGGEAVTPNEFIRYDATRSSSALASSLCIFTNSSQKIATSLSTTSFNVSAAITGISISVVRYTRK